MCYNNSLNGIKFVKDTNGKWGYYEAGADSVTPFKGLPAYQIGTGGNISFNIPIGTTKAYLYRANIRKTGSNDFSIDGNIITKQIILDQQIKYDTIVTCAYYIYKLILNGNAGTITITSSLNVANGVRNFYNLFY